MIRDFVSDNMPDGGIIFVDEIDKIAQAKSGNEWSQFLRCEIMSLLDGRMPLGMDDNEWDEDLFSNSAIAKPTPSQLQQSLNDRFFVVAAGAFQEAWEHHAKPAIGFEPLQASTKGFILKTEAIERELLNRFRRHLIHVDVTPADYQQMIKTVAKQLPKDQAENFRKLAQQRLSKAIDEMRGVRFLEELLLDSMLKIEKTESSKTPNL
jgi:hypothetical protein